MNSNKIHFFIWTQIFFSALFFSCSGPALKSNPENNPGYLAISGDSVLSLAVKLSSEQFAGRETGSAEYDSAAVLVQKKLKNAGLTPFLNSWYHPFSVKISYPDQDSSFLLTGQKNLKYGTDYTPFYQDHKVNYTYQGELIFDGYGSRESGIQASELLNSPVKNKWVLLAPGFPSGNKKPRFSDPGGLITKLTAYQTLGAAGILMLPDSALNSEFEERSRYLTSNQYELSDDTVSFPGFRSLPVFVLSEAAGKHLADDLYGNENNLSLLIKKGAVLPKAVRSLSIQTSLRLKTKEVSISNLIGMVPGKNKDELILVGAHLDHLGKNSDGTIYSGADDNASGVSVVAELARTFQIAAKAGIQPEKTIVFAIFNGEEKGLLGSSALAGQLNESGIKITAMVNLDMVGRENQDSIEIVGHNRFSTRFKKLIESLDGKAGLTLNQNLNKPGLTGDVFYRSDHYPFSLRDIPVLFLTDAMGENHNRNSQTDDYHRLSDTGDKLNKVKLERVTRLCFLILSKLSEEKTPFKSDLSY
ncbi:MAG: M28 family peptidase [Bacteroidetes bacterium]|nr:M28 family peptidase [Bacteroidota bacterium]